MSKDKAKITTGWRYFAIAIIAFLFGWGLGRNSWNLSIDEQGQIAATNSTRQETTVDTQWVGSDEFITFDTAIVEVYRNTGFEKSFKDFEAPVYRGKKMAIDYKSNPIAREYKTRITSDYQNEPINFAGHYIIAEWMCGTPCQNSVVMDILNGKVYPGVMASSGYDYRPNSKLLIVNPPDSFGWYMPMHILNGTPEYYMWENNRFKQLH